MTSKLRFVALASVACLMAACGSKGSESTEPSADQSATPDTNAAAPADTATPAAAPAPTADSTDTLDKTTLASFTGDAAKGKIIFMQCQACHSNEPGVNKIGPSLAGVVGRKAGQIPGFQYSDANKSSGITWTPEKLFQYLENPQRVVPGTKMTFAGLPKAQDRADVIAYLKSPTP
jgi:cytochrome c